MSNERNNGDVAMQQLAPQPVLSIRATIRTADLGETVGNRIAALKDYLRRRGLQPSGPPFARYHTFSESETDFELGVPVAEPVAGEGGIAAGELPGGWVITTWHIGPHDKLGDAYARIDAWLQAQGRAPDGPPWEAYHWLALGQYDDSLTLPDSSGWRTQLVQPIK